MSCENLVGHEVGRWEVVSRIRSVRRRVRCVRKGHYWLPRRDSHGDVALFCRRCGRRGRRPGEIDVREDRLHVRISVD
jgi:hypothetical protein